MVKLLGPNKASVILDPTEVIAPHTTPCIMDPAIPSDGCFFSTFSILFFLCFVNLFFLLTVFFLLLFLLNTDIFY